MTTPAPWWLQKELRLAADRGVRYVVVEASSHGLEQNRLWGVGFEVGVVTNVTHDHLDYHGTYEKYLAEKAKLVKKAKMAVLNGDDESYGKLKSQNSNVKTYGRGVLSDFNPRNFPFQTKLPGVYNQYNCLAAIAACSVLGIKARVIREEVERFEGVEGRMEEIKKGQNFRVYVDFASTPHALKNVLEYLKRETEGELWVVFGSAGERDRQKRPMMGKIACKLADKVILTAEDPRTEKVEEIIEQIVAGCEDREKVFKVPDRREAIRLVIDKAREGDVVVICGKGHERSMCFGKTEYPWSDQGEARKALGDRQDG